MKKGKFKKIKNFLFHFLRFRYRICFAYIDTNNCPFALELLKYGFAQDTGLTKKSGFCTYPLWVFNEEFLNEIGSENYKIYSDEYDKYMSSYCGCSDDEDSNDCDDEA